MEQLKFILYKEKNRMHRTQLYRSAKMLYSALKNKKNIKKKAQELYLVASQYLLIGHQNSLCLFLISIAAKYFNQNI